MREKISFGHGTDNAVDEAAWLVLETLDLPMDETAPLDKVLTVLEQKAVLAIIKKRIETRKPAAYLLKKAYLQGLPFYVDERVIVPRSFIGELLPDFGLMRPPKTILDLCTGSGCLAVLAAYLFPKAKVDAVDLSAQALAVARRNVRDHRMEKRVRLFKGDLFTPLKGKKYDLIITNPPYVDAKGMKRLPQEYRHEPEMALGSGKDGLDITRRILKEAASHLTPDGGILCEIGRGKTLLEKAYPRLPFLWLDTALSEGEVFWLTRKQLVAGN
ncbi:MAG: 50S ribosomal protein L3 N(5)-glutamine methyltransferase [Alphaproteobacteria bacterium]|nr:50S ribosomal protein L3 N(5)-glutamine methyltransferase [Alphaproteobacteria bacterium]